MEKKHRLVCIGMLAHSPFVYCFMGNKIINFYKKENESKNIFFFCVQKISELMNSIKTESSLFYWVDCIYTHNESDVKYLIDKIKTKGYISKYEKCRFALFKNDSKNIQISFTQCKKEGIEKKSFNLPMTSYESNSEKIEINNLLFSGNFDRLAEIFNEKKKKNARD